MSRTGGIQTWDLSNLLHPLCHLSYRASVETDLSTRKTGKLDVPLISATNKTYLKTAKKFHLTDLQARSKSNGGGVKTINNNLESSSQRIDQANCCDSNPQILKNQAMGQAGNSAKSTLIQSSTNQGTKGKFMGTLGSGLREWRGDFIH